MKRVVLEELTPGMVLAKPVTNSEDGRAGLRAALDDATIGRLRQLGLASVYIEGEAGSSDGKTLAELEADLDSRFSRVNQDPQQRLILEAIRQHLRNTHGVGEASGSSS